MKKKSSRTMKKKPSGTKDIIVKIVPFGPDKETIDSITSWLPNHSVVQKYLKGTRNRMLSFEILDSHSENKNDRLQDQLNRFRATFYDYTNNRTIYAEGQFDKPKIIDVSESSNQPLPSSEEFEEAVQILLRDKKIGPAIKEKIIVPYPPMPPLIISELPDGRVERTVAVGLLPVREKKWHEIVGVNMIRQEIIRFEGNAPPTAAAHNPICGLPLANQATARNVPGQVRITVTQGGTVLWNFLAIRPAASSGTNGSGIELRFVDYRGKRVLYRAHVPILNVRYKGDACGPYRDWQNQESMIQATGTDVAPGFRLCTAPATTILDSGSDAGNFLGVAIYVQGQEVVLVSEMEAGWYRYVCEWRLHANGTIRPRFGFSAVQNSCVCTVHYHHAYWRFDFDIRTAANNRVREFNDPILVGSSNWHNKTYEIRRPRDPSRKRKWRVENTVTGEAYDIIPGPKDGVATSSPDWPFPRGDVWVLRYHGNEIDDGVHATGPPYEADIDHFVNGEPISNNDVVVWYGAHFTHDLAAEPPGTYGDIVGPDLKLVKW